MAAKKAVAKPNVSTEELKTYYRDMLLIRRFEEKAGQLYGMGLIGGFCHLYIGQEAVVVGLEAVAEEGDKRITSYRDHGHMLACGMDANGVMAELTGREGGYSKGKGGSMHMFSKEKHFYGGHGIVGAQVPLGAGLAFADKYLDNGRVTFTYFGDGAANQGQVYETFNMAALWSLPVVFVIENNQYAMGRHRRGPPRPRIFTHAANPLAFRVKRWMAWMFWPLRPQAPRPLRIADQAKVRTSWKSKPIAIVVTLCRILRNIAPAKKYKKCATNAIPLKMYVSCWSKAAMPPRMI